MAVLLCVAVVDVLAVPEDGVLVLEAAPSALLLLLLLVVVVSKKSLMFRIWVAFELSPWLCDLSKLAQLGVPLDPSLSEVHSDHMALVAQTLWPSLKTLPPGLVHEVKSWVIMVARLA